MNEKVILVLEKGLIAGGIEVSKKDLGLSLKKQALFLQELCDDGYLAPASKKNKFKITPQGFQYWQENNEDEYCQKIKEEAQEKFLNIVEKKQGKKLTATDMKNCYPQWQQDIFVAGWIKEKAVGKFEILPAGRDFLFSRLPIEKQLEFKKQKLEEELQQKEQMHQEELQSLQNAEDELKRKFRELQQQKQNNLEELLPDQQLQMELDNALETKLNQCLKASSELFEELKHRAIFKYAMQHFQTRMQEEKNELEGKIRQESQDQKEQIEKVKEKIQQAQQKLEDDSQKIRIEIEQLQKKIDLTKEELQRYQQDTSTQFQELNDLTKLVASNRQAEEQKSKAIAFNESKLVGFAESKEVEPEREEPKKQISSVPSVKPQLIDEDRLITFMKKCFHKMVAKEFFSKVVAIPDFYREIQLAFPRLSIAKFKQVLNQLCDNVIIDLLPVNEISNIEEPEFAITSPVGDLYYVLWK